METATHTDSAPLSVLHTGPLGVNTIVVRLGGQYAFVTDPAACSFCGDAEALRSYFLTEGIVPVAVVLTHGHFDHVAALPHLREWYPSVPVAIHKNDSGYLGHDSAMQRESLARVGFADFYAAVRNLPEASCLLSDGKTLRDCLPDVPACCREPLSEWRVMHTPGHTKGSVCLYNERRGLLLGGDTVFYRSWGRTDLPDGNDASMRASLKRIYGSLPKETLVFPGHDEYGFALSENL